MIARHISATVKRAARHYPIVAIIGPRQSGKTTLARALFPRFAYVNLEAPDMRLFATRDPRGFLATYPAHAIFDEVQRTPELFSYLQVHADESEKQGQHILTGSQNFLMMKNISQSLAGRVAIHTLLPFSSGELATHRFLPPATHWSHPVFLGGYPRAVISPGESPTQWYGNYVQTYLDRDVRLLSAVGDITSFERFLRLCAGRVGQIVNLSSLANDTGISHNTAKAWLSILEASFIVFTLQPYYKNFNKRLIKSPKLYFYDTGLACWLLGITGEAQIITHPLAGALFETWIVSEYYKWRFNRGDRPRAYFWRDKTGHEIDLLVDEAGRLFPIEVKSGTTVGGDFFKNISYFQTLTDTKASAVIYGGVDTQQRFQTTVYPWREIDRLFTQSDRIAR
ncbi:hypothetical protein A2875_01170 [Candidatus Gottesmanbacteria bacterium RIFCSPHIGHO2_01_FULL_46_14]|uniref:AAA family ATPase n=1 Tax=Candidatus Gottesmanbacteria bacterium RIFCSPHIGHO2_01_FULL_46_14 TaxID=1798380 RepID=A0A1F5ZMQ0_9BACT|nr:MAG: hypothetical protein A2875_01170 [Candidatus Gottesmanbacteria bacterium RIFCSPHIGHO2_01_FULL_46_14]